MNKKRNLLFPLSLLVIVSFLIMTAAIPGNAKTLTNKDVKSEQNKSNKNVPEYIPGKTRPTVPPGANSSGSGTLTNKDIQKLYKKQNKGLPTKSSHPEVPTIPPPGPSTTGSGAAIVKKHLPYMEWAPEYEQYFAEHYRDTSLKLNPKMIVIHYSGTQTFSQLWWTFMNGGTYEGKPGHLSVHLVVDKDGSIYELMPLNRRARSTYGVNHVAISIDLIGTSENDILKRPKQLKVSYALVKWLMKTYKIPKEKVLGHYEVAKGKEIVPEYTDYYDADYPNRYPPGSRTRGPGKAYMFKLRYYLLEPR